MNRYRAILFDLFDTVALIDRERIPSFTWNGSTTRATTGALRELYESHVPDIPFARFVAAIEDVAREQRETRTRDLREVPCAVRFARTLQRTGLPASPSTDRLAAQLARIHSSLIGAAADVPPEHARLLDRLRSTHTLALVSNFDDAEIARQILRKGAVFDFFRHIAISVDHGWRKPSSNIFEDALAALGVAPRDALFVGDSPEDDVKGAKRVGMDVVWVNADGGPFPGHLPLPDRTISTLPALRDLLQNPTI